MSTSTRFRAVALAGVAAVIALGAGFMLFGRGGSSTAAPSVIKPLHPVKKAPRKPARPAKRPRHPQVLNGLPAPLTRALRRKSVVVVSLYQTRSSVDDMATAEARVGASNAGAGFVAINVLNNAHMRALTNFLGSSQDAVNRLLDDPAVLIFQRPAKLFLRFNGYTDQQTVQQAAVNAAPVGTLATVDNGDAWVTQADATCTRMRQQMAVFVGAFLQSPTDATTTVNRILAIIQATVAQLASIQAPAGMRAEIQKMIADYNGALAKLHAAFAAARAGDRSKAQTLTNQADTLARQGDQIASRLGATSCSG